MKQFDVVANPAEGSADFAPFVVVLSSHLIDLDLIVIAPMLKMQSVTERGLIVPVLFKAEPYQVSILELAGAPSSRLRRSVGSVSDYEDEIRRAIDRVFTGF